MKHKNFFDDYSEVMFDERDVIEKFLINVGGEWHFDNPVEVMTNNGDCVNVVKIKLDADLIVSFDVKVGSHTELSWDCCNFAYGELSTIIDALPELNELTCIMDTTNGHNELLVKKINNAWWNKSKRDFGIIVYSLAMRDYEECEYLTDNIGEFLSSIIDNHDKDAIHAVLQNVCDDKDLETILSFIRYEE